MPKKPDLLEWRVDFFQAIDQTADVLALAQDIRQAAGGIPVLFTRRSIREGGEMIALVSMSMGAYGSLTRFFGWAFGSAMSFAIGAAASAPGQVPIEDLNQVLAILQQSLAPKK